jgi:endonuclease YncB( thermonuclease family)
LNPSILRRIQARDLHIIRAINLAALALALTFSPVLHAHPGGKDKDGCHVDSSTSERHCHKQETFDPSKPAHAGDEGALFGSLVSVKDGDTFVVKIQGYAMDFRLAGIDAPEMDQPFGAKAREELVALIGKQQCVLVPFDTDRYGRTVAYLWIKDTYVNREMVKRGAAWFYDEFAADNSLYDVENAARDAKRGLWALPLKQRVEPWEWRRERREGRATSVGR